MAHPIYYHTFYNPQPTFIVIMVWAFNCTRTEFWPQAALWIFIQILLHAKSRYLRDSLTPPRPHPYQLFWLWKFVNSSFLARHIVIIWFLNSAGNRIIETGNGIILVDDFKLWNVVKSSILARDIVIIVFLDQTGNRIIETGNGIIETGNGIILTLFSEIFTFQ